VLEGVLGAPPAALSLQFDAWLKARFAEPLKHVAAVRDSTPVKDELRDALRAGRTLEQAGNLDQAIEAYLRAYRMFPAMADPDAPAWLLARAYHQKGDTTKALEYLSQVTRIQESNLEANRLEGDLLARRGRWQDAARAYERAIYISPYDPAVHTALSAAAAASGDHRTAVRERQAVLALRPTDRAEALYHLAVAQRDAGDRTGARRTVLAALEEAPSFERAQTLLLELRRTDR
jgi:cellulose synthase operon protein C